MGRQVMHVLGEVIEQMPNLKTLDISYNSLSNSDLSHVVEALCYFEGCKLRNLNLSGNHGYHNEVRGSQANVPERLTDLIQRLVKSSVTLQHLDLSSMSLDHN